MKKNIRMPAAVSTAIAVTLIAAGTLAYSSFGASHSDEMEGSEEAIITTAPNLPPAISRDHATKVIVHLFTEEKIGRLADGVQYTFWTFNGTGPGRMIRVRQGDLVEIHLSNDPSNMMSHNIDLHAAMGPGGGAASSVTLPGHTSVFSFKAMLPANLKDRAAFVLVSFDPARDTPQTLRSLAQQRGLDDGSWELLTGKRPDIRTLADMLGVEFKIQADGSFKHSSQITVLNDAGEIIHKHIDLNEPIGDVVQAIENASLQSRSAGSGQINQPDYK